jgi:hypothetical protein
LKDTDKNAQPEEGEGQLFKKKGAGLIWRTKDVEFDLTKPQVVYPQSNSIENLNFPAYRFSDNENSGMGFAGQALNFVIDGKCRATVDQDGLNISLLKLGTGQLRESEGNLLWSASGKEYCLNKAAEGSKEQPSIGFASDPTVGFFSKMRGEMAFAAEKKEVIQFSESGIKLIDGKEEDPAISFAGDSTSGMFRTEEGVGISVEGRLSTMFSAKGLKTNSLSIAELELNGNKVKMAENLKFNNKCFTGSVTKKVESGAVNIGSILAYSGGK